MGFQINLMPVASYFLFPEFAGYDVNHGDKFAQSIDLVDIHQELDAS